MFCTFCPNCDFGEVVKCTEKEVQERKYPFPNIGICDICGTSYIMHYRSGKIFMLTVLFKINKPITSTSRSLKLYQRISFSLFERKTIVAVRLGSKNIDRILSIVRPINTSNGILKQVEADIKTDTISIVPKKIKGFYK